MTTPFWLKAAWEWLKKYWKWLLFPLGILAYVIGRATAAKSITVVSPELVGHQEVKDKLDAESAVKKKAADESAAAQLSGIEASRSAQVSSETQKQIDKIEEVQGDPAQVSELLKNIGKDIRSGR